MSDRKNREELLDDIHRLSKDIQRTKIDVEKQVQEQEK